MRGHVNVCMILSASASGSGVRSDGLTIIGQQPPPQPHSSHAAPSPTTLTYSSAELDELIDDHRQERVRLACHELARALAFGNG